jgi:hypothetical protein
MKKEMFDRLVEGVKQAVKIYRGEQQPSRVFEIPTPTKQPSHETIAAIEEVRDMKKKPAKDKSYTDVDEMMKDLLK